MPDRPQRQAERRMCGTSSGAQPGEIGSRTMPRTGSLGKKVVRSHGTGSPCTSSGYASGQPTWEPVGHFLLAEAAGNPEFVRTS